MLAEKVSPCGEKRVVFRKGEKDEKEVWVEVWEGKGVVNVRSVGDVVGSVYNDTSFGGIRWNAAGDRFFLLFFFSSQSFLLSHI